MALSLRETISIYSNKVVAMNFEELTAILDRVTWIPWAKFTLNFDKLEGIYLVLESTIPDSGNPEKPIDLRIVTWVPPMKTEEDFMDWLLWRLNRIAVHESTEWLKLDGIRWLNPHEMER